jgi:hypothetical protein
MSGGHLAAFLGSLVIAGYFVVTPLLVRSFAQSRRSLRGIAARLHSRRPVDVGREARCRGGGDHRLLGAAHLLP